MARVPQKYENVKSALCMKHDRKCFTSCLGKCPMTKYNCYEFMNLSELYSSLKAADKKKVKDILEQECKDAGRSIDDFENGIFLL